MASENTETNAGNDEETGPPSEPNEHDYAHSAATNLTDTEASSCSGPPAGDSGGTAQESFPTPAEPEQSAPVQPPASLSVELPEPAVGAEVDCPGVNDAEAASPPPPPRTEEDTAKTAASVPSGTTRGRRRRPKRPEDMNCCCCKSEFERQGRSFNRRAVYTFTTPDTVQWAFPEAVAHEKSFLCETCAQVIRSKCKRKQTGKRSLWLKPPVTNKVSVTDTITTCC